MTGADGEGHRIIVAGMGEIKAVDCSSDRSTILKVTVGSCIGFFLSNERMGSVGVAHIMLPERIRGDEQVGKYADTAIPELLRYTLKSADVGALKAYVVGGACMFGGENTSFVANIGERNIEAVRVIAEKLGIAVVFDDTGGNQGRTATFDCQDYSISVKTLKKVS